LGVGDGLLDLGGMIVAGLPAAGGGVGLFGDGAVSAHESGSSEERVFSRT